MPIITNFEDQVIKLIKRNKSPWFAAAMNLGGVAGPSGGSGIPPGGLQGQLIQRRVAYDITEASYSGIKTTPPSGSLVDNLAHIRFRLDALESGGGGITSIEVRDEGIKQGDATVLDFIGTGITATVSGTIATIISGSGGGNGGTTITFGSENEIPVTNSTSDDFDYDSGFKFDGTELSVPQVVVTNGNLTVSGYVGIGQDPSIFTPEYPLHVRFLDTGLSLSNINGIVIEAQNPSINLMANSQANSSIDFINEHTVPGTDAHIKYDNYYRYMEFVVGKNKTALVFDSSQPNGPFWYPSGILFNPQRLALDFIVRTDTREAFFIDSETSRIGIYAPSTLNKYWHNNPPEGTVHIKVADSGITPTSGAKELVIESDVSTGMSFLTTDSANESIVFGFASDSFYHAMIGYGPSYPTHAGKMGLYVANDVRALITTSGLEFQQSSEISVPAADTLTLSGDSINLDVGLGALNITTTAISLPTSVDITLENAVDALNIDSNTLSIDASNGRVGILTAAPTTPLTIGPDPLAPLNANEMLQLAKTNDVYMTIRDGTAVFLQGSTSGLPFMGTQSNHDITFRTNNAEKVRIKNTGEVGINTISPDHLLHIVDDAIGLMMERTGATTNLVGSAAIYKYTTSEDMQDGHGAGLLFAIEDDAAVNNYIAGLQAIRNGADDTGMLRVIVREGGVERNVVDFKHNEVVFNEDSRDVNYRFEGDGEDNLLYIDGGYDSIGIGINSLNSTGRKVIAVAGGTAPGASLTDAAQLWVEDVAAGIADFKMRTEGGVVGRLLNVSTTVYHNTTQSIPNNTWTNLAFNSEISDDEGWHDPTTNNDRITPLEAGEYMFFLQNCNFESNSTGQREAQIFSSTHGNLNFFTINAIGGGKATFLPVFAHRYISGGYIVCQVRQNSGGALNILGFPKFTAIKIK